MSDQVTIKAVGDWELEVRAIPFGKDRDNQVFTQYTDYMLDAFKSPLIVYQHGFANRNAYEKRPVVIGKTLGVDKRADGVYVRILLDKTKEYAQRVWEAAKNGLAAASSGSVYHLARMMRNGIEQMYDKAASGEITVWPFAELSLWDMSPDNVQPASHQAIAYPVLKALYEDAGLDFPNLREPEANGGAGADPATAVREGGGNEPALKPTDQPHRKETMSDKVITAADLDAAKAQGRAELEAELKAERERQAEIEQARQEAAEAVKAEYEAKLKEAEEAATKSRRLSEKNVNINHMPELGKYDHLSPEDQAVLVGVLNAEDGQGRKFNRASEHAVKALAYKIDEATKSNDNETRRLGVVGSQAMKAAGIKADEIQQQDLTSYGDEWVGVAYSQALWESIRAGTFVAANLPSIEVPAGHESINIPLESGDPTFYKVAEATDTASSGWPNATITSSQMGTDKKSLTLSKMGARVLWSGELEEDSLIPFVGQLRAQLSKAGAEQLEHAIIDGDTASGASANINDIAGTPAATDLFLMFNGFRKSPLVTTTANSRDAGVLTAEDFLETVKLMGTAGLNAFDKSKVWFIVDPSTYWKALELEEVKSRDVFVQPTIEGGELRGIYGYQLRPSFFMHYKDSDRLANSSGKVDVDTVSNNSTGAILAVRWDQWLLGYRRRMTMETTRIARADSTEIVALARLGLAQRDTEASAISYNVTV